MWIIGNKYIQFYCYIKKNVHGFQLFELLPTQNVLDEDSNPAVGGGGCTDGFVLQLYIYICYYLIICSSGSLQTASLRKYQQSYPYG